MKQDWAIPSGRMVDLTHVLKPYEEQYTLEVSLRGDRKGEEGDIMNTVYFWSHVGTHVEAPLHFLSSGGDTASISVDALMGPVQAAERRFLSIASGWVTSALCSAVWASLAGCSVPSRRIASAITCWARPAFCSRLASAMLALTWASRGCQQSKSVTIETLA